MVISSSFFKFRQQTVTLHKCVSNAVCCIIIAVYYYFCVVFYLA